MMTKTMKMLCMLLICVFTISCGAVNADQKTSEPSQKASSEDVSASSATSSNDVSSSASTATDLTEQANNGLTFTLNSQCVESKPSFFTDPQTGNTYAVTASPGTETQIAKKMTDILADKRLETNFNEFGFAIRDADYSEVVTDCGDHYQYNILTLRYKNGSGNHIAYVSSGKVLACIETGFQNKERESSALAETERIIRSLKIDQQQVKAPEPKAENTYDTQTIGNETMGYVTIPSTWVKFLDVDGGTDLQYSNETGTDIITLNIFDTAGLSKEQLASLDAKTAASSVWYNLEQNGVEQITGAQATLGKFDAFQLFGMFEREDDGLASMIVCWVFEDDNGAFHYISAEGLLESAVKTASYVQNSYTLEK